MKPYRYNPTVDKETNEARIEAHRWFDPLWQFGLMVRNDAYKALANEMCMRLEDCHISKFSREQCLAVRGHVKRIRERVS